MVVGQLHVTGTVDGVDVDDLATRSLKREALQSQLVEGKITVDGAVHLNSAPNLHVVNNKSWADHLGKVNRWIFIFIFLFLNHEEYAIH